MSPGIKDHNSDTIEVSITTLDSYISQSVNMIKIDVEGYEFNVLNGWRKLIKNITEKGFDYYKPGTFSPDYDVFLRKDISDNKQNWSY